MKTLLVLLAFLAAPLNAAEKSRTWTDTQGRVLVGSLVAKSEGGVSVRLASGKTVELRLDSLSEECAAYAATADLSKTPVMQVRTSKIKSNSAGAKQDERSIDIVLTGIPPEAGMEVVVVWLGEGAGKGGVGVWETDTLPAGESGTLVASTIFNGNRAAYGANFKGWAAGLRNKDGVWISQAASMEVYKRFLLNDED
jgi:hypothetical protein